MREKKLKWIQEPVNTSLEFLKSSRIQLRSRALRRARDFFYTQGYEEVDCPILSPYAPIDNHIDLFSTDTTPKYYLHSSPEYGMKRLLAEGSCSIFQISHVFRANEKGSKHASEFTMAEFYKLNINFNDFIDETLAFIELFTGSKQKLFLTYQEAFLKHLNIDPYQDLAMLCSLLEEKLAIDTSSYNQDDILACAMGCLIEPAFEKDLLVVVTHFPLSQAALAESKNNLALRFEIYHQGLELANGYKELKDAKELKNRLTHLNALRLDQNKELYPIDTSFLEALEAYFPECCGVACGFDRLLMLELKASDIKDVLALPSI